MLMDDKYLQKLNIKAHEIGGVIFLDTSNVIDEYEVFSIPAQYCKFDGDTLLYKPSGFDKYLGLYKDNIVCSFCMKGYNCDIEFYIYAILKSDWLYNVLLKLANIGSILSGKGELIRVYDKQRIHQS